MTLAILLGYYILFILLTPLCFRRIDMIMHKQNFKHFLDSVKTVLLLSENLTMNKRVQQSDV